MYERYHKVAKNINKTNQKIKVVNMIQVQLAIINMSSQKRNNQGR